MAFDPLPEAAPAPEGAVWPDRTVAFLGLPFVPVTGPELVGHMRDAGSALAPFRYLVTPNVDHMVRLAADPGLLPLYRDAWAVVCDSRILQTLAARSGLGLPAVPGSDLTAALLDQVIAPDEPVVVIGGDPELVDALRARYGLTDIRWHAPPMGLRRNPAAIAEAAAFVAAHPARFHFLCVGSPQQEMVAQAIAARGDAVGIGLCVGASLDFLTGKAARAPRWMQAARLEWLHRLLSEPRRMWRRYLVEGPRIFVLWWRWQRAQADGQSR
jgi:exopolysaccharide biosynthesis WecB/TagA/CpsF family protein